MYSNLIYTRVLILCYHVVTMAIYLSYIGAATSWLPQRKGIITGTIVAGFGGGMLAGLLYTYALSVCVNILYNRNIQHLYPYSFLYTPMLLPYFYYILYTNTGSFIFSFVASSCLYLGTDRYAIENGLVDGYFLPNSPVVNNVPVRLIYSTYYTYYLLVLFTLNCMCFHVYILFLLLHLSLYKRYYNI